MVEEKCLDFWHGVVFSDETMMELSQKRRVYVRRPPKSASNPRYAEKNSFVPQKKLMIWGCIRSNGERLLVPIKNKVNSDVYISFLKENVMDFLYLHEVFQQDNAPTHSALKTKEFFGDNGFLILENWLQQSPDINIIENVWHILKKNVARRFPKNLDELWKFSEEEFYKIPDEYIKNLFDSISKRLNLVVKNKGYPNNY